MRQTAFQKHTWQKMLCQAQIDTVKGLSAVEEKNYGNSK